MTVKTLRIFIFSSNIHSDGEGHHQGPAGCVPEADAEAAGLQPQCVLHLAQQTRGQHSGNQSAPGSGEIKGQDKL